MVLFRIISLVLIAAALMLLGADALTWLETGGENFTPRTLTQVTDLIMGDGTAAGWVAMSPEAVQSPGVQTVFDAPSWAGLGGLGLILALLFRRRD
jgi:hypothetical protein